MRQRTLRNKTTLKGVGLHSGNTVRCTLHPAPEGHGIVFVRSDLRSQQKIRADISRVIRTEMNTTIGQNGVSIATVEHLMAALAGKGIDNALIEIDGPEVPILDGSSVEFVAAIDAAGTVNQVGLRKVLKLRKKISIQNGERWIIGQPDHVYAIKGSISFKHPSIGDQMYRYVQTEKSFQSELASARTFGFVREVDFLHKRGLALGASLKNAVVLDDERVVNPEGLRYANEFVRHKVLDAIGDLALLGMEIQGSIEIHKSGHELHAAFMRKVLEDPSNYQIIEPESAEKVSAVAPSDEEDAEIPLVAAAAY